MIFITGVDIKISIVHYQNYLSNKSKCANAVVKQKFFNHKCKMQLIMYM